MSAERRDALAIAASKLAISGVVLWQGFRALSDDDHARVVIAQRFAAAPALDPSGTSWLPFPFWIYGATMQLLGRDPVVARATAIGLGVAGALLVWTAARWLGTGRLAALVSALLAAAFPYSAWLGVATVPEALTAALVVFGCASASVTGPRRLLGAAALCAACLSRYEAWPVAFVFAALSARDALSLRDRSAAAAALIALAGPAAWIVHGVTSHGDALFFLARVAAYRRALGAAPGSVAGGLFGYPLAFVRCEPELVTLTACAVFGAWKTRQARFARYRRLLWQLGALLAFLVIGDVLDGAPTHHGERAVLALWFAAALVAGDSLVVAASALDARSRRRLALAGAASVLFAALVVRPLFARRDAFIDRSAELAIGLEARQALAGGERLAIYTTDLGFFAVIAGFSAPERTLIVDEHDPRRRADTLSASTLRERLTAERAAWLIAPRATEPALSQGKIHTERDGFVLIRARGN